MSSKDIKEKMNDLIIEEVEKCVGSNDTARSPIMEAPRSDMEASKSGFNTGNVLSRNLATPETPKVNS